MVCQRGGSSFTAKAKLAEEAGAWGVVVVQNQAKWPHVMDDTSGAGATLGIPATMVSQSDGARLLEHCATHSSEGVTGTISTRELRTCAICHEAFGEKATRLPCRHHYH